MKKNVLIVEPASSSANIFSLFSYLPLLGTVYLGTLLKNNGFNVTVLNENILKRGLTESELNADFLLISCLTPTVTRGYELAKKYKTLRPDGKVIMGGPHVTFMKEEASEYADHIVLGEGENVIVDLLKYGSDEKYIQGTPVKDLDTLPFIDWKLLKGHEKGNLAAIMTSRGCPFACNFCSVTGMFGRGYRAMSPERVIEEVKRVQKKWIFFYDDNFTADIRRADKIMDGLISLGVKPKSWTTQVRADVTKRPELVEKMARAGCDRVYIGFESINPVALKSLQKSQTPEDVAMSIKILHKYGIKIHGMFIYGSDSDDPAVVTATQQFVKNNKIDSVQYSILTPFPGTELYRNIEGEGRIIHKDWKHYDGLHVVFWPEKFSPFSLQQHAMQSFKDFYSLANAANEALNMFADTTIKGLLRISNYGRSHTYSLKNALFKAGGKIIIGRWNRLNASYMHYLSQISLAKTGLVK